ncbi:Argininosuccinate lyase [Acinetobacter baumannii]|nr:Argininosuccinate lyase [Acinetobacter baumannii]
MLTESAQAARHHADKRCGRGKADGHFPQFAAIQARRLFRRAADLIEHLIGFFEEHLPGLRQADVAVVARQQPRADHLLQRLDLLAERRLGDTQPLGGAAKMQLFRHGDKVTQVSQLDIHI